MVGDGDDTIMICKKKRYMEVMTPECPLSSSCCDAATAFPSLEFQGGHFRLFSHLLLRCLPIPKYLKDTFWLIASFFQLPLWNTSTRHRITDICLGTHRIRCCLHQFSDHFKETAECKISFPFRIYLKSVDYI